MRLFSSIEFRNTRKKVNELFKNSKINKKENDSYHKVINKIEDSNKACHRSDLYNLNKELSQRNIEIIKIQKKIISDRAEMATEKEDTIPKLKNLRGLDNGKTDTMVYLLDRPKKNNEESNYEKTKKWINQFDDLEKANSLRGFDKFQIQKSIGDPRYLELIQDRKEYQNELSQLIEDCTEENFQDLAIFLKNKNESTQLVRVLGKHLHNASRDRMMYVVSKIYEGSKERTNKIVSNVYLNQGDFDSAKEISFTEPLEEVSLGNCAEIAIEKKDYVTALQCYAELKKEIPMEKILELIIKKINISATEELVQKVPATRTAFKNVLFKIIKSEHFGSSLLIQIINLFNKTVEYKECAEIFVRRLFKSGDYTQGIKIIHLQQLDLSQELLGFILSEFEIQISQKNTLTEGSINDLCGLLIARGNEKIVLNMEEKIKEYYYQNGAEEEFMEFNLLLWGIHKKKKNLIEYAA